MTLDILHDTEQQRFTAKLADNTDLALLTYRINEPNKIDFYYSYVPPSYRGKGIAKELVTKGLAWANSKDYQIYASCSYVAQFVE